MPFPSLNEMMQAIQASQQNAFIPAYQQSQKMAQDRAMQEQQIQKLMQEIEMTRDMHPLDMAGKEASTRYNNALSRGQELAADERLTKQGRPGYLPAIDAEHSKIMSDADLAKHTATIKSAEANTAPDASMAMRAFFEKPGRATATGTSPEAWLKQAAIDAGLQGDSMRARASAAGAGAKRSLNPTEATIQSKAAFEAASDAYKSYVASKGIKTKEQFQSDPEALRLYQQALRAQELFNIFTTSTKTTDSAFEGLPPVITETRKGGKASSPNKPIVDEQGRIHLD